MLVVLCKVRKGMQGHITCFFVPECVYAPHIVMLVVLGKVRKGMQGHIACFLFLSVFMPTHRNACGSW